MTKQHSNIKTDFTYNEWIRLSLNREQWLALGNNVMSYRNS